MRIVPTRRLVAAVEDLLLWRDPKASGALVGGAMTITTTATTRVYAIYAPVDMDTIHEKKSHT